MNAPLPNASGFALRPVTWFGPSRIKSFDRSASRGVAQGRRRRGYRLRNIERQLEPVPGCLVGELDPPGDLNGRPGTGQFADDRARSVDAVQPETSGLALECTGGVTIAAGVACRIRTSGPTNQASALLPRRAIPIDG